MARIHLFEFEDQKWFPVFFKKLHNRLFTIPVEQNRNVQTCCSFAC